jgi:hypothetical protein
MSSMATVEPLEIQDEELTRGRAHLEGADPSERDTGGGSDGNLPPPEPPPVDRDERPERPPRWRRWLAAAIFVLSLLLVCGTWMQLGAALERWRLERKR